jgi:HAD superfamily hydrolase (TIGR01484 family)
MRYYALATDYDGTLASQGQVDDATLSALQRLRSSGRKLIMVTGRELDDLARVFPHLDLFDRVVAENGALLYRPATREEKLLAEAPQARFIAALRKRAVPISVGRVIVGTHEPHETTVLEVIRDLGVEFQVIFNKGAVMVLPSGVNKATGLRAALNELALSPHNVVGVGDAENDHAFLNLCEGAVAVANALPAVKEAADLVTKQSHGAGVTELVDRLIATDLRELAPRLKRHALLLGTRKEGEEFRLDPCGVSVLLSGPSGTGKSTFATGFLERLVEHHYQFCIVDPEGDYPKFDGAVVLGDSKRVPTVNETMQLLERPDQNAVVNLLGTALEHRPAAFERLLSALLELRARTGRPHWMIIDETHHLLPPTWAPALPNLPKKLNGMMLITVHPDQIAPAVLSSVDLIIAIGGSPEETIRQFSKALGEPPPNVPSAPLQPGEAVAWWRQPKSEPFWFQSIPPRSERLRHIRKYAEGELPPHRSFFFQGPNGKLNLRAQNLMLFMQLAEGVDDETWTYHLNRGDYSNWFRKMIKDPELADEADRISKKTNLSPKESRAQIRGKIEARYTGAA